MDELILEMAEENEIDPELINTLLDWERARVHLKVRRNLVPDLREILERVAIEENS